MIELAMMLDAPSVSAPLEAVATTAAASGVSVFGPAFFATAQPNSALDMVQRLPGFQFDSGGDVRGFAGAGGNVLIDGQRPAAKTDNLSDTLNRIPANSVARVELIRGGAPGINMQGRSVMANVVLKSGARTELTYIIGTKAFGDGRLGPVGRLDVARRDGQKSISASLTYYNDQYDDSGTGASTIRSQPSGPVQTLSGVKVSALDQGYRFRSAAQAPALGGLFHLNFALNYDTVRETEQDALIDFSAGGQFRAEYARQQDRTRKGELGGDYVRKLGHDLEIKIVGLQTLTTETYGARSLQAGSMQVYDQLARSGESIGRVETTWKPRPSFSLQAGGEIAFNFNDSESRFSQDGVPVALPSAHVRVEEQRGEAFVTATWRATSTLNLEAGARIETSEISQAGDSTQSASFTFPKPRLAATWSPTKVDQIRLSFERLVGQLNFSDFAASANLVAGQVNAGNANLEPQREWRTEAAYERKFWGDGSIVATWRHAEIEQVIDVIPVQGVDAPGNIGDGSRDTWLLSLTAPLRAVGMPGGQFKTDGKWISSRVIDPTTHQSRSISGDRPYEVTLSLINDMPRLKSSWTVELWTGTRIRTWRIEESRLEVYKPWLSATWELKPYKGTSFLFQMNNMLGRDRTRDRVTYEGLRDQSPIAAVEHYSVSMPPFVYVRLRQTV